jgi:hypothetical protein
MEETGDSRRFGRANIYGPYSSIDIFPLIRSRGQVEHMGEKRNTLQRGNLKEIDHLQHLGYVGL